MEIDLSNKDTNTTETNKDGNSQPFSSGTLVPENNSIEENLEDISLIGSDIYNTSPRALDSREISRDTTSIVNTIPARSNTSNTRIPYTKDIRISTSTGLYRNHRGNRA